MILKFKRGKGSNAWHYEQLSNAVIGRVDFSSIITKYINKDTGKLDINLDNYNEIKNDVRYIIENEIGYSYFLNGYVENIIKELQIILKNTNYIIVKNRNHNKDDVKLIATEAYLMLDDGKTIERLI